MTINEVINKLTQEWAMETGDLENSQVARKYITRALDIGINHFTADMEEIIQLTRAGTEIARFKGVTDTATRIGIHQSYISAVLTGVQHTAGGFKFMKLKDWELVPRPNPEPDPEQDLDMDDRTVGSAL